MGKICSKKNIIQTKNKNLSTNSDQFETQEEDSSKENSAGSFLENEAKLDYYETSNINNQSNKKHSIKKLCISELNSIKKEEIQSSRINNLPKVLKIIHIRQNNDGQFNTVTNNYSISKGIEFRDLLNY